MDHPGQPHEHRTPYGPTPSSGWEAFHDRLDAEVERLSNGGFLDLSTAGSSWRIRISAGWPGVDGPGTLAYHLRVGSNMRGGLGTWAATPFGRNHGYFATRVAGEISALGLESDPTGVANPSMIACGAVADLEVADVAVELLREVFEVIEVEAIRTTPGDGTGEQAAAAPAEEGATDSAGAAHHASGDGGVRHWWSGVGFDPDAEVEPHGNTVVGHVENILVELTRDNRSLPGLTLVVARARLTDPNAVPIALPSRDAAALLSWMRNAGGDGISVDTVRGAGRTVHGWATRMVCSDAAKGALGRIEALDGAQGDAEAAAEAVREVLDFVTATRRSQPHVIRPTRLMAVLDD